MAKLAEGIENKDAEPIAVKLETEPGKGIDGNELCETAQEHAEEQNISNDEEESSSNVTPATKDENVQVELKDQEEDGEKDDNRLHRGLSLNAEEDEELSMIRSMIQAEEDKDATKLLEAQQKYLTSPAAVNVSSDQPSPGTNTSAVPDGETLPGDSTFNFDQSWERTDGGNAYQSDFGSPGSHHSNSPENLKNRPLPPLPVNDDSPRRRTLRTLGASIIDGILTTLEQTKLDPNGSEAETSERIENNNNLSNEGVDGDGNVDMSLFESEFERGLLSEMLKLVGDDAPTLAFAGSVRSTVEFKWWCMACLRARRWRLERSVELLERYSRWREKFDPDAIELDEFEDHLKSEPFYVIPNARCRNGRGILVVKPGNHVPKRFRGDLVVRSFHRVMMNALRQDESLQAQGFTVVVDLKGLGLRNFDRKTYEKLFGMMKASFPMRYGKLCLVNPSNTFNFVYRIASFMLSRKMKARILRIPRSNPQLLLTIVDEQSLPQEFGGTLQVSVAEWIASQLPVQSRLSTDGELTDGNEDEIDGVAV